MSSTDIEELRDHVEHKDVGDRVSVKEMEKRAKALEARRINGLKQIMQSADGRLWMWRFLETCGLFSVTFNGNSRDYFQLGMRNAGMPTFSDIQKYCMDEYILMTKEMNNA